MHVALFSRLGAWVSRHRSGTMLALIVLLGLLVRLPGMNYCVSPDEANACDSFVRGGFRTIFLEHYGATNHPLASFLTWISWRLFGESDWAMQLPSFIIGVALIPMIYALSLRLFQDRAVALSAAFFLSWSPFPVAYSATIRGYIPELFFAMLSALCLHGLLKRPTWRCAMGLSLSVWLMALSHLASLVLLGAWGAVLGGYLVVSLVSVRRRDWTPFKAWAVACAALGIGLIFVHISYLPVFSLFSGVFQRAVSGAWSKAMVNYLADAEQKAWYPFYNYTAAVTGCDGLFFWPGAVIALVGITGACRRRSFSGAALCFCAIACPTAAYLVFHLKLEPRYILFMAPFFMLCLGFGVVIVARALSSLLCRVVRLPDALGGAAAYCAISLLVAAFVFPCVSSNFPYGAPALACVSTDWKSGVMRIAEEMGPDDVVLVNATWVYPIEFYLNRYVYPHLHTAVEPPARRTLWVIGTEYGECGDYLPPGATPEHLASFEGCDLSRVEVSLPLLRRVELPPFVINQEKDLSIRLAPWHIDGDPTSVRLMTSETGNGAGEASLVLTPVCRYPYWQLTSPAYPCQAGNLVVFQAEFHGETERRSLGLRLCFLDAKQQPVEERWMRVPCTPGTQGGEDGFWKPLRLAAMVPGPARSMTASLCLKPPLEMDSLIAFRRCQLWVRSPEPVAPPAVAGQP